MNTSIKTLKEIAIDVCCRRFQESQCLFKGDAETLMIAMEDADKENPNKMLEVQRALRDGDLNDL